MPTQLAQAESVLILPSDVSDPIGTVFRLLVGGNTVYDANYLNGNAALQLYAIDASCASAFPPAPHKTSRCLHYQRGSNQTAWRAPQPNPCAILAA